ncbi:MAG: outer membrane beta-barrel protein [Steroidobacteraceae bacterium]
MRCCDADKCSEPKNISRRCHLPLLSSDVAPHPRRRSTRPPGALPAAALLLTAMFCHASLAAASVLSDLWPNVTLGARFGSSNSTLDDHGLASTLAGRGYAISDDVSGGSTTTSFYADYGMGDDWSLEMGWTYLGHARTTFTGPTPEDLQALLAVAADVTHGGGNTQWLAAQYRYPLFGWLDLDLRAGAYLWSADSNLYVDGMHALSRTDHGFGYTFGAGPHLALGEHWGVGLSVDLYASGNDNRFWQETVSLDYRF